MSLDLSQAAEICGGTLIGKNIPLANVSTDTRALNPGDIFLALKGEKFDAHEFVSEAYAKHAAALIVDKKIALDIPQLVVPSTHAALLQLAAYWRSQVNIPVAAITGSCGKTTSKNILANILSLMGNVLASPRSFNNDIGVPLTLLKLNPEHQFAVLEIGANHTQEIEPLSLLARPTVATITNVHPVHLEGFGSLENIAKAKAEIFAGLNKEGTAVLNRDDVFFDFWQHMLSLKKQLHFSIKEKADVFAKNIHLTEQAYTHFDLHFPQGQFSVSLPLMGMHNVYNALVAATSAYALNIPLEKIKLGLETVKPVYSRLETQLGYAGAMIIDDSYNANPASVSAAILVLKQAAKQSILVLGDMLELGPDAKHFHTLIGEEAKQAGIQHFYCYGPLSYYAAQGYGKEACHFSDKESLIENLMPLLNENVTVLIKGSRGMNMTSIVEALRK